MSYRDQLQKLHDSILGRHDEALALIANTRNSFTSQERLDVYRSAYHIRLMENVRGDYPATQQLMGEARMDGAIHAFVEATPPSVWDANQYSPAFAAFLQSELAHEPAIVALAMIEGAIAAAFWGAQSHALTAAALATLSEEEMAAQCFTLRAASKLLSLPADAEPYLAAYRAGEVLPEITAQPAHMLVLRHEHAVHRHVLEAAEYGLLAVMQNGQSFGEALEASPNPETLAERLPHYLSRWLEHGFLTQN